MDYMIPVCKKQRILYNLMGLSNFNDFSAKIILVSENHQTNIYDQGEESLSSIS